MGGFPCTDTMIDLDGDTGNGCETDISAGAICIVFERGLCMAWPKWTHPLFSNDVNPDWITTNSAGLNQLTGASPTQGPLFTRVGSTSIFSGSSYDGQLDLSTGQITFSGARGGTDPPADTCPLSAPAPAPARVEVRCKGKATLVSAAEIEHQTDD
jgi:hypothetical protein